MENDHTICGCPADDCNKVKINHKNHSGDQKVTVLNFLRLNRYGNLPGLPDSQIASTAFHPVRIGPARRR